MQMEDNTADELNGKIADLMQRIKLFTLEMDEEFNVRVRQLFIEAIGAQVTAMENCVNAMTLLVVQAKDAGFVECNRQIRETLRSMNTVTAGPLGVVHEMPGQNVSFMLPENDDITKAAIKAHVANVSGNPPDYFGANELKKLRERTARLVTELEVDPALDTDGFNAKPPHNGGVLKHRMETVTRDGMTVTRYTDLEAHAPAVPTGVSDASVTGADEVAGLVNTEGVRIVQVGENSFHTEPAERAIDELAHAVADEGYVIHKLKIWPQWFEDVSSELKTFEVRLNDRGFKTGDYLDLREFSPDANEYTGRRVLREISYCVDLEPIGLVDHVALGIAKVKPVNG